MSQSQWRKRKVTARRPEPAKPWLPIALIVGGVVVLFGVLAALALGGRGGKVAVQVSGRPSIQVDQQKVDLGNVALGRAVDVRFKVSNVGDQTLWFTENPYVEVKEGC